MIVRRSVVARQQLRDAIQADIEQRTKAHQAKVAALRSVRRRPLVAGAAPPIEPLVMLAHGDSWFDYPLDGNSIPLGNTDVIAHLETMGHVNPLVLNVSHHGDASTDELSWPKQQRMIDALTDADNWPNGKPDAILFSAGGNDVAGDQFCIFLDYANSGGSGLNHNRFDEALGMVRASYEDLFVFRDRNAPGVPIFGHCYDFPIPNGAHPICAGPWLLPSLRFAGWTQQQGAGILHAALTAFKNMLTQLAGVAANNFILVDTQGTLNPDDWANELHPFPEGFKKIANLFVTALRAKFGNRI